MPNILPYTADPTSRHVDVSRPRPTTSGIRTCLLSRSWLPGPSVAGVMCACNAIDGSPLWQRSADERHSSRAMEIHRLCNQRLLGPGRFLPLSQDPSQCHRRGGRCADTRHRCGMQVSVYKTLVNAVREGWVKENRLICHCAASSPSRLRLGCLIPTSMVSCAHAGFSIGKPDHRAHAPKMARQSIVLLKNQNNLPLSKNCANRRGRSERR